jgi:RNA polymerase sigma factor (TIGR02999 family)
MSDLTLLLDAAGAGDRKAAAEVLPHVYEELRKLAAARLAQESIGQTLEPTALVHEAYLRLVGGSDANRWANRSHFFAAAATAMRRILIESARRKSAHKRGGGCKRIELTDLPASAPPEELLALDEALTKLAERDPVRAEL